MDVLNPPLEEIDGIMYRINYVDHLEFSAQAESIPYFEDGYDYHKPDRIDNAAPDDDDDDDKQLNVEVLNSGNYRIQFHVPKILHHSLIGPKGSTRQRLERETRTRIRIPRRDEEGRIVAVTGNAKRNVKKAYRMILSLVTTARMKLPFTHFLSLPTNTSQFKKQFLQFKAAVLEKCGRDRGVQEDLFQIPEKFHVTIGVLLLADDEERRIAIEMLESCKETIMDPITRRRPLKVRICGVDTMNDDPSEANVLFANVIGEDDTLQRLVDGIASYFKNSGFAVGRWYTNVKVHVTLMNSSFLEARKLNAEPTKQSTSRITFDASSILKKFADFQFAELELNCIHLSQRYAVGRDGYYLPSCQISFT